jgi:iron complex transport system substrate-binding protein
MLFALGLGDRVAAVTHECDYPPGAEQLPHLTRSVIPDGLSAAEIDAAVRERTGRGESLYELDEETLEELDVDLIVAQAVCEVCAVSFDDVQAVAERLPTHPEVISLDPSTLGEVIAEVPRKPASASRRWSARWPARRARGWPRSSGSTRCTWAATGFRR